MKFHLLGEENEKVEIEVLARTHADTTNYWDINWIESNIKVDIPGYLVHFNASLRTDELRDFVNELKLMNGNLKGKATLNNLDNYLHFECEMNHLGKIQWSGETCFPSGNGAVLNFEFTSDQSYLQSLIEELNAILEAFPVIGKP